MAITRITLSVPEETARRIKKAADGAPVSSWVTRLIEDHLETSELDRQWKLFYGQVSPKRSDVARASAIHARLTDEGRREEAPAAPSTTTRIEASERPARTKLRSPKPATDGKALKTPSSTAKRGPKATAQEADEADDRRAARSSPVPAKRDARRSKAAGSDERRHGTNGRTKKPALRPARTPVLEGVSTTDALAGPSPTKRMKLDRGRASTATRAKATKPADARVAKAPHGRGASRPNGRPKTAGKTAPPRSRAKASTKSKARRVAVPAKDDTRSGAKPRPTKPSRKSR